MLTALFDIISYYKGYDRGGAEHQGVARDFFVAATYVIIAGAIVSLGTALTGFLGLVEGPGQGSLERRSGQGETYTGVAHRKLAHDSDAYCHCDRDYRYYCPSSTIH